MLFCQAELIWPQEREMLLSYDLPKEGEFKILDVGCGSGEACRRMVKLFPHADVWGVDLIDVNVEYCSKEANKLPASEGERLHFVCGSAYELEKHLSLGSFHLVVCRSVLHAIPTPEKVMQQMRRVTKKGGYVHMLNEDYGLLWSWPRKEGDACWKGCIEFLQNTGSNPYMGRSSLTVVREHMCSKNDIVNVQYITVDNVRCDGKTLKKMFETWRDGYLHIIAKNSSVPYEALLSSFNECINACVAEGQYMCWQIVIATVRAATD